VKVVLEGPAALGARDAAPGAASGAANHHYRAVAVGDALLADRAEEHAHELAVTVTPDDDEMSAETELVSVPGSSGGPAANWPGRRPTKPGHGAGQQRQIQ